MDLTPRQYLDFKSLVNPPAPQLQSVSVKIVGVSKTNQRKISGHPVERFEFDRFIEHQKTDMQIGF
jgi:hypothetical protein